MAVDLKDLQIKKDAPNILQIANQNLEQVATDGLKIGMKGLQWVGNRMEDLDKSVNLRAFAGLPSEQDYKSAGMTPPPEPKWQSDILDYSFHDARGHLAGGIGNVVGAGSRLLGADPQTSEKINDVAETIAQVAIPQTADLALGAGYYKRLLIKSPKLAKLAIKAADAGNTKAWRSLSNALNPELAIAGMPGVTTRNVNELVNTLAIKGGGQGFSKTVTKTAPVTRAVKATQVDDLVQPDFSKPHRNIKQHTTKHKSVEEYQNAWNEWPNKTKAGRDQFYKTHGVYIEDGLKLKPNPTKDKNLFGPGVSNRLDAEAVTRKQRGSILTYLSGEKAVPLEKIRYKDASGTVITPHHRTSHGELAPWVDFIRSKLNSKDPKIQAEGREMLEIGRKIFQKNKIKVGDTLANYEGYSRKAHLGKGSIHSNLTEDVITGPSSRSAFDFTKGKNILSRGILHKGKRIPTKEYLQMLPWKEGVKNSEFGENTFWSTLVDYIQTSNVPRKKARIRVLKTHGPQGTNWSAKELNRLRKLKVNR